MAKRGKQEKGRASKKKKVAVRGKAGRGGPGRHQGDKAEIEVIARGVWIVGSHVLLCENVEKDYLYLPGGHVEFGESAPEALAREFVEESGVRVRVGGLVMVSEGRFTTKKRMHHEVNLVFHVEQGGERVRVERKTGLPVVKSKEPGIAFRWVDGAAVVDLDVRPESAKAFLAAGAGHAGGVVWMPIVT